MSKRLKQPDESFDEERAEEYVKEHKRHAAFMYGPFLKDMRKLKVSGRCLEIGAGAGIFTSLFAGQHPDLHLTVTDISPKMIALARETIRESLGEEEAKKRTDFFVCDVNDESALRKLGQFDLVYSVYSMHHWQNPESAILHLFKAINGNGILYLGDLKRVWWLYYLPSKKRDIEQVRASYAIGEVKKMLGRNGISRYEMKSLFPFFLQSIVVKKQ